MLGVVWDATSSRKGTKAQNWKVLKWVANRNSHGKLATIRFGLPNSVDVSGNFGEDEG